MSESALEPRKVTHLFYHMMRQISSESSHYPNISPFYLAQLYFSLYGTVRIFLVTFMSQLRPPPLSYLPYDPLAYALGHPSTHLDSNVPLTVLASEFFILYCYFLIYRQPATSYSIRWFDHIVIQFQDKSREALLSLTERKRILKESVDRWDALLMEKFHRVYPLFGRGLSQASTRLISRLCSAVQIWLSLANFNKPDLFRQPLPVQPNLSSALRWRLLLSLQVAEWLFLAGHVIVFLTANQFFILTYLRIREGLTWAALPLACSDIPSIYYQVYQLLNLAFFFTFCTLISVLVNMGHCRHLCRQLAGTLLKGKRANTPFRRQVFNGRLARQFSRFLPDYYRCIGLATYGNGQLFSLVLFAFFLSNVPINIYFIVQIVFNSENGSMLIISYITCVFQAVALYAVLGPLAFFCAAMHRPTKILPVAQLQLAPSCLLLKLKLDNLQFRLLNHAPVTISVGPLSPVTHSFIFEFVSMYTGYLLMAFSMQMNL